MKERLWHMLFAVVLLGASCGMSVFGQWFTSGVLLALGSLVVWFGVLAVDSEV
jgi:hypothetical protein